MNIFKQLFSKKTIQTDNYSISKITDASIFNYLMDTQMQKSNVRTTWAQLCIREMAKKVSNFETILKEKDKELKDHEFLRAINKNNRYNQNWAIVHQLITKSILFYGRAIVWPVEDKVGRLSNFVLLPDSTVDIISLPGGFGIDYFKIKGYNGYLELKPEQLILITEGSLSDPYRSEALIDDICNSIERDNLQQSFQKSVYQNFGAIGMVLESEDKLNEADVKFYRDVLNQYALDNNSNRGAGSGLVLGNKLKVKSMTQSFKDLDFSNTRTDIRDEILAKFQLPKIAFGIYDGTYANSDTATENYIKDIIIPFSKQIENSFNMYVKTKYGDSYELEYEYPEGISERDIQIYNTMVAHPEDWTLNERRAYLNGDKIQGGDVLQNNSGSLNNGTTNK